MKSEPEDLNDADVHAPADLMELYETVEWAKAIDPEFNEESWHQALSQLGEGS